MLQSFENLNLLQRGQWQNMSKIEFYFKCQIKSQTFYSTIMVSFFLKLQQNKMLCLLNSFKCFSKGMSLL